MCPASAGMHRPGTAIDFHYVKNIFFNYNNNLFYNRANNEPVARKMCETDYKSIYLNKISELIFIFDLEPFVRVKLFVVKKLQAEAQSELTYLQNGENFANNSDNGRLQKIDWIIFNFLNPRHKKSVHSVIAARNSSGRRVGEWICDIPTPY